MRKHELNTETWLHSNKKADRDRGELSDHLRSPAEVMWEIGLTLATTLGLPLQQILSSSLWVPNEVLAAMILTKTRTDAPDRNRTRSAYMAPIFSGAPNPLSNICSSELTLMAHIGMRPRGHPRPAV